MAQPKTLSLRAWKIINPKNQVVFDGGAATTGTTKDLVLAIDGVSVVFTAIPARSGSTSASDTCIQTSDGWTINIIQEFSDVITALSATDMTSS